MTDPAPLAVFEAKKPCITCSAVKALSEFPNNPNMKDGHLNRCRPCENEHQRKRRLAKLEYYRAYDRERNKAIERKQRVKNDYLRRMASEEGRKRKLRVTKKWSDNNKLAKRAHGQVSDAIEAGKLMPLPCERCGATPAQAHHEDYSKPLDVIWLCPHHHGERHREINAERRRAA